MQTLDLGSDLTVDALSAIGTALATGDLQAAIAAVETISVPAVTPVPRRPLSISLIATVFQRDHFGCRYCGKRTVPTSVLRAISSVPALQDKFPYHPAKRTDSTHPAYRSHGATCDHIVPIARGGNRDRLDNLATACWECNRSKADRMLDQIQLDLRPLPQEDAWDGLTGSYRAIWEAGGRQNKSFHEQWMRAFRV